ncbi:hypothetical protein HYT24_03435 [Candidatus Pacearchaeota archaeon]|nr:hypothetical protein [Candidatus Pacearchaeota archaeon]
MKKTLSRLGLLALLGVAACQTDDVERLLLENTTAYTGDYLAIDTNDGIPFEYAGAIKSSSRYTNQILVPYIEDKMTLGYLPKGVKGVPTRNNLGNIVAWTINPRNYDVGSREEREIVEPVAGSVPAVEDKEEKAGSGGPAVGGR